MKVNHIWCPPPASPSVTPIYEVLISFWGFRASVRDTNLVNQLPASRQQRDQNLVHKASGTCVLKIKTSYIAARLSVGGEIKTSYIHYIYSIYIVFPEIKTS